MIRKALLTSTAATPNVQAPQPQKPNMVLARPAARPREGAARQRRRPCQGTRRVTGGDEDADSDDDDEDADEGGGDGDLDSLVPDPQVCREFGVSAMTLWRWDRDPFLLKLGWPPPVYLRKRKYRGRKPLEKFKNALLRRAIKTRNKQVA